MRSTIGSMSKSSLFTSDLMAFDNAVAPSSSVPKMASRKSSRNVSLRPVQLKSLVQA